MPRRMMTNVSRVQLRTSKSVFLQLKGSSSKTKGRVSHLRAFREEGGVGDAAADDDECVTCLTVPIQDF